MKNLKTFESYNSEMTREEMMNYLCNWGWEMSELEEIETEKMRKICGMTPKEMSESKKSKFTSFEVFISPEYKIIGDTKSEDGYLAVKNGESWDFVFRPENFYSIEDLVNQSKNWLAKKDPNHLVYNKTFYLYK